MPGSIVVIGSSNVDLIMKMDRLPKVGESVPNATFMQTFGGKGANQAVAAALAGGRIQFVNCVGDDPYGGMVLQNMRSAGVDTSFMTAESGVATGTALIMIGGKGENYLSVAPGANYRLLPAHIDAARESIRQSTLVMLQYEIRPETLAYAVEVAYELLKPVMLNLAPAHALPEGLLEKIAYLVVNETEAEFLCGLTVDSITSAQKAAQTLLSQGPKVVILTLGVQGALVAQGGLMELIPAFPVQAVDTTAAGDTFCGALAAALVEGQSLAEGVKFASAAAAISVTRLGAQPSIPTRAEVEAFLKERGE